MRYFLSSVALALIIPVLVSIGIISVPSVLLLPVGLLVGNIIRKVLNKYLEEK